jgi:hypothetical protein
MLQIDGNELPPREKDAQEWKGTSYFRPVAEVFATDIVLEFAFDDAKVKDIAKRFPKTNKQIPHLKKLLQTWLDMKD